MSYFVVKTVHVLGVVLFLGAGLGSALTKLRADATGDVRIIAWAHRYIVTADTVFTIPSAFIVPISGLWLSYGNWTAPWVLVPICAFVVMGILWLPAYWLQIRMRDMADAALAADRPLPPEFRRATRTWLALGVPAFVLAIATVWVMVSKQV